MNSCLKTTLMAGALVLSPIAATTASAATLIIPMAGIASNGLEGSAGNVVRTYLLGANAAITGWSYSISMTAIDPSWLNEMQVLFTNSAQTDGVRISLVPYQHPGSVTVTRSFHLADLGLAFNLAPDGILRLEFCELYDDPGRDGLYTAGTMTFEYTTSGSPSAVPEPATWGLMIAGFAMAGAALRRRRSALAA